MYLSILDLELQYLLDAKKEKTKRLFFLQQEGESQRNQTITVTKGQTFRESFKVHLPASGIHDKLTSIDVQVQNKSYVTREANYCGLPLFFPTDSTTVASAHVILK